MHFFKNPNIQFMQVRKTVFLVSGLLVLASIVSLILHGGPRYSIDFRGGTFLEVKFIDKNDPEKELNIPISRVRQVFSDLQMGTSEIKHYGSPQDIAIQLDAEIGTDSEAINTIYQNLHKAFPDYDIEERRRETVGPKVGSELVADAIWAILFSMLLILVYVMFRFELRFGVGAILATFHDVIITLGIFSVFDIEISVPIVAALLTIVGYSLNDTIVVFDRIRENMKTFKRKASDFPDMVNRSINETLSRTIITSGTTLLVVIILYFFGGEILKDFAFALICGIIIGTYSSIFIASPILVEWEARKSAASVPVKKK